MAEDTKQEATKEAAKVAKAAPAAPAPKKIEKHPTPFQHVFLVDINDDGVFREVAVLKEDPQSGSLHYVDVMLLDNFDKSRLKKIVMSMHADKYQLWELMANERLPNGINALDYFHQMVRVKTAPGFVNTIHGGGLMSVGREGQSIAGGFTNPGAASFG